MTRDSNIIRFGNDGWIARFDTGFDQQSVVRVADALGRLWSAHADSSVYVGFDTRYGIDGLAREAAAVLAAYGLTVYLSSAACPTPALAWTAAQDAKALGVVMFTASERASKYGGILLRGADGGPQPRDFIDRLEQEIGRAATPERAHVQTVDVMPGYIEELRSLIDVDAIRRFAPRVVVDPMFGATTGYLAHLLTELGCLVNEIHRGPREEFDGIHPDPHTPWTDACEQAVRAQGAALGVSLDGDGDRVAIVDEKSHLFESHIVVALLLEHLVKNHQVHGCVATTITCSAIIARQARLQKCRHIEVPVDFRRIYREVVEGDVILGAEEYGGVCLPAHLVERDGMLAALLIIEYMALTGCTLSQLREELIARVGEMYHARRDLRLEPAETQAFRNILPGLNPQTIADHTPCEVSHADGLRLRFDNDAWVLMRPSRTSSVVRVYAEAPSKAERDKLLDAACALVRAGV